MITQEQEQYVRSLVDKQVTALKQTYESEIAQLRTQAKSLTVDVLQLQQENARLRDATAVGRGLIRGSARNLNKQDFAKMLPAKLEEHSLEEVVSMQALDAGIDPRNEREFAAWLGAEGTKPSVAQMTKRLSQ